jgi:beta-glucosidase-like glycosyl hydrolase
MNNHDEADLRSRVARLSLEQKVRLLTGADFWALYPEPAAGLRRVVTSDGPAGVRGETWDERDTSANVPSPTALAATWDCDRVEAIGRLLAAEARRKGVDVLLAPRSPGRSAAGAPPSTRPIRSPRSTGCARPGSTWRSRREPSGT